MPFSKQIIVYTVLAVVPALVAFGLGAIVALLRRTRLWLMPGWIAAAAVAPLIAVFFGVRMLISVLQGMAITGGGLAAVSAGMWEATQPVLLASYVACAIMLGTVIASVRGIVDDDEEEAARSSSTPNLLAIVVTLLAIGAVAVVIGLFRNVSGIVFNIMDPTVTQTMGIADTSQMLATRIKLTALIAGAMTMLLLGVVVLNAVMRPTGEPWPSVGRAIAFASFIALVGLVFNVISLPSWAGTLYETAVTGQIPR